MATAEEVAYKDPSSPKLALKLWKVLRYYAPLLDSPIISILTPKESSAILSYRGQLSTSIPPPSVPLMATSSYLSSSFNTLTILRCVHNRASPRVVVSCQLKAHPPQLSTSIQSRGDLLHQLSSLRYTISNEWIGPSCGTYDNIAQMLHRSYIALLAIASDRLQP
jgi:hypothetical protein